MRFAPQVVFPCKRSRSSGISRASKQTFFTEAMRYRIQDFIIKAACLRSSDVLTDYDLTFGFEDLALFRSPINARPVRSLSLGNDGTRTYINADRILFLQGVKGRNLGIDGDIVLKPPAMELANFCNPKANPKFLAELARRLSGKDCVLRAAPIESLSTDGQVIYFENKIQVVEPA